MPLPSRYTPLWEKLKKDGKVTIVTVPILRRRIVKAVRARAYFDQAFKLELLEENRKVWILHEFKDNKLTFTLKYYAYMEGL